jgi:hypothetical protein
MILISVKMVSRPQGHLRPEGLTHYKIPITLSGIETVTQLITPADIFHLSFHHQMQLRQSHVFICKHVSAIQLRSTRAHKIHETLIHKH